MFPQVHNDYIGDVIDAYIKLHEIMSVGMGGMVHASDIAVAKDVRQTMELPDRPAEALEKFQKVLNEEITNRARAKGIPMPDLNALSTIKEPLRRYCFPNFFLLSRFGNMAAYRIGR